MSGYIGEAMRTRGAYQAALGAGAREMLPPRDFPGGRFAIVGDPQGAAFGLLKMAAG